jgi:O-antigen ligase
MFSSELDRVRDPLLSRSRGILLGTLILICVAASLVSARTLPFVFAVTILGFGAAETIAGRLNGLSPPRDSVFWHIVVFLAYAAVSTAWGMDALGGLRSIALAAFFAIGAIIMSNALARERRADLLHMSEGFWIGFAVAFVYLLVETFTGQAVKIWLYNQLGLHQGQLAPEGYFQWRGSRLIAIAGDDLTRNMAVLTMFLWPAVLALRGAFKPRVGKALVAFTVIGGATAVMLSTHESSKLAIVGSIAVFAIALVAPRVAGRLTAIGWVVACLAVLPSALLAHRLDLHNAGWLQDSARHRIIIWNFTAEQVLKSPWLGVGARTTYVLGPRLEQRHLATAPDEKFRRTLSTHSHSVYLQTWFELGLIGATLLTLLGLAILQAIGTLMPMAQPYAYATFVAAALMASSSYGMWQSWFNGMFALSAALFVLSLTAIKARPG